ncbi:Fimbrial protein precursor [Collimonas arenae]|uniref:Fimbrial protein n=1 Tax=Collimonas arenae TaxID=279058 RepID=A0A0A1FFM4_9BURK|nr:fimbrial protein [Collimonas arenae]AIY41647.1 Fimbrial protein precursor [Collimonas arenae]
MKKNLIVAAIAAASVFVAFAPAAYAADGEISIEGNITSKTCTINGGNKNFTVTLPTVSAGTLAVAGTWAGRTPFTIKLTNCSPTGGQVATYFEPGPTVNKDTGRLRVDTGGATKVEIGLLTDAFASIDAAAAVGSQKSQVVSISTAGAAELNYYAQYESTGGTTEGRVRTRVNYTMMYQ